MISCPKCGNNKEFAVVTASVLSIYVDGDGDTISQETLADACTGVDRVECSICREELGDIGYDFISEKAFLYSKKYEKANAIKTP